MSDYYKNMPRPIVKMLAVYFLSLYAQGTIEREFLFHLQDFKDNVWIKLIEHSRSFAERYQIDVDFVNDVLVDLLERFLLGADETAQQVDYRMRLSFQGSHLDPNRLQTLYGHEGRLKHFNTLLKALGRPQINAPAIIDGAQQLPEDMPLEDNDYVVEQVEDNLEEVPVDVNVDGYFNFLDDDEGNHRRGANFEEEPLDLYSFTQVEDNQDGNDGDRAEFNFEHFDIDGAFKGL